MKKLLCRILIIAVIVGAVGLCAVIGIDFYVRSSVSEYILNSEQAYTTDADCVLVLGAGVYGESPTYMLRDRLETGIDLYKNGAGKKLIMSGDHGRNNYDEVNVMKQYAIDKGVPSEDVFMDHAGFSTYESMYRARDIFAVKKLVIVSQEYHLYRALYNARALGLEAYAVSTSVNPDVYYGQNYRDLREVAARVKDFLYCIVKPEPTFLGEVIPVSGSGDMTNDKSFR